MRSARGLLGVGLLLAACGPARPPLELESSASIGAALLKWDTQELAPFQASGQTGGAAVALAGDTALVSHGTDHVLPFSRTAGKWSVGPKLSVDNGPAEGFASALAISGDTAFVGAPLRTVAGRPSQGAVYVFTRAAAGWTKANYELVLADGAGGERFGASLSTSNGSLLVGAPGAHTNAGAAYVFTQVGSVWTQGPEISAPFWLPGYPTLGLASSVAISGDFVYLGAPAQGLALVFRRDDTGAWQYNDSRNSSDGQHLKGFGSAVALGGNIAAVGTSDGGVAVLKGDGAGWIGDTSLVPSETPTYGFGHALAIAGDRVLIGAPDANVAYLFAHSGSGWVELEPPLTPSSSGQGLAFGSALAIDGDTALIGSDNGFAEIFSLSTSCSSAADCASGFCVDGVCCDRACDGQCESCGEPGSLGRCIQVSGAARGTRTACEGALCLDTEFIPAAACGASGSCEHPATVECPDLLRCNADGCLSSCVTNEDCALGSYCQDFSCHTHGIAIPDPCSADAQCPQGYYCKEQFCAPGSAVDAGGPGTAGGPPVAASTDDGARVAACGCRVAGSPASMLGELSFVGLALALARRRRAHCDMRRRERQAHTPRCI